MTQEITYNDLYNVYGACNQALGELKQKQMRAHGQFLNFLMTNRDRAYKILVEFEKDRPEPDDKTKEYFNKTGELRKSLSREKDEKDEDFKVRKEAVDVQLKTLEEEYAEEIKVWEEKQKEFEGKLEGKTKFNSSQLKQAYLPDNMDTTVMETLYKFITQTE